MLVHLYSLSYSGFAGTPLGHPDTHGLLEVEHSDAFALRVAVVQSIHRFSLVFKVPPHTLGELMSLSRANKGSELLKVQLSVSVGIRSSPVCGHLGHLSGAVRGIRHVLDHLLVSQSLLSVSGASSKGIELCLDVSFNISLKCGVDFNLLCLGHRD